MTAITSLTQVLKRVSGRRALEEFGPTSDNALKLLYDNIGGEDKAWEYAGQSLKEVFEEGERKEKMVATQTLIGFVTTNERLRGDPIDASSLTEEEQIQILMEPAKKLLMENAEFRRLLLEEPDVRLQLLGELGVEVIEADDSDDDVEELLEPPGSADETG